MRRLLPLALVTLATACTDRPVGEDSDAGSSTTSNSTTTSTATTESPTTEAPTTGGTTDAPDPCLEHRYASGGSHAWMLTCGLPELCGGAEPLLFSTTTLEPSAPEEIEVDDLDRARCMAAALRDRTPGQIAWSQVVGPDVIFSPLSLEIVQGTALVRNVDGLQEFVLPDTYEGMYPLRPPEFFAACAEGDALALWQCLMDAVEPACLPGPMTCPK
ncbi:hypothetical protein [Nannocystis bainbridge]|uniref:Lipoprotein n=1 Tax=Nannocystis bainbridge TaxID=2995303 RepID=A0ABT5E8U6_9BACT|nr:hypothetical protein [Nannocystis bainbridge]MDC0722284.1 hypothetical protein [Nannocystis bainbridge]